MEISIATASLESISTHITTAARLANLLDSGIPVVVALTKSIDEIGRTVEALLGKPYTPRPAGESITQPLGKPYATRTAGEPPQDDVPELNIANAVDDLRQLIAKADALVHATEYFSDEAIPTEDSEARRRRERLAHLVGATTEAVAAALEAADQFAVALATRRMGM